MTKQDSRLLAALTILSVACLPMLAQASGPEEAGTFHGEVHATSGSVEILAAKNGTKVLRLTNFKTSNGPDVHVVLVAADDAVDNQKFLPGGTERIEIGKLKGNEGNQNYTIPAGTDLGKFKTVLIYCERFNATFGAAPLHH